MQDPVYSRIESTPRPTLFAASGFICLASIGLWVAELILALLPESGVGAMIVENAVYYLPFVLLPLALYARRRPGLSGAMRLNPLPALPTLSVALLGLMSVYVSSALTIVWGIGLNALGLHSPGAAPLPETRQALALSILTMAAFPAVCEELLFRGFALAAWESRGTWYAVGVTSALFALLHGNLFGLPAYLLVGAVAGFVTFALDSVYAGMVYHTIYNAACLVIPWLTSARGGGETAMSASLVFSMALESLTIIAMMAMLLASLRLRARNRGIAPIPRIRRPLERRDRLMLLAAVASMLVTGLAVLFIAARMAAGNGGTP